MALVDIIVERIREKGPISVGEYLDLCMAHPELGYYMRKDPFGTKGDFTTAPEVSQMFGEMIGLWAADIWTKLGSPAKFILCECGPGRGTLMKDILRAFKIVHGLPEAAQIHLVETSPLLIEKQKQSLPDLHVIWHDSLNTLPVDMPLILIGNEFFDALPVEQALKTKEGWRQRKINEKLEFVMGDLLEGDDFPYGQTNDIYEFSPVRDIVWMDICDRLKTQHGAALIIDYGFTIDGVGETLQALKNHKYAKIFDTPGETDLSSHVNFSRLKKLAEGLNIYGPGSQADFLKGLGIEIRAEKLIEHNPEKRQAIGLDLKRLIHPKEMGEFKVIYVSNF